MKDGLMLKRAVDIALAMEIAVRNATTYIGGRSRRGWRCCICPSSAVTGSPKTSTRVVAPPASGAHMLPLQGVDDLASKCGQKHTKCFCCGKMAYFARVHVSEQGQRRFPAAVVPEFGEAFRAKLSVHQTSRRSGR